MAVYNVIGRFPEPAAWEDTTVPGHSPGNYQHVPSRDSHASTGLPPAQALALAGQQVGTKRVLQKDQSARGENSDSREGRHSASTQGSHFKLVTDNTKPWAKYI